MKKLTTLLLLLAGINLQAITHETISYGFWQDSTVWLSGIVPDTTSSDTFIIKHALVIDNDLVLKSGAYMLIENEGGICGHQIATISTNASVEVYGILELDEFYVHGGKVRVNTGLLRLTTYAEIREQGASLKVENEARAVVGEWFECMSPNFDFALDRTVSVSEALENSTLSVYPNPFTTSISIDTPTDNNTIVKVCDLTGREVFTSEFTSSGSSVFDLGFLNDGVYILTVSTSDGSYSTRVLKN